MPLADLTGPPNRPKTRALSRYSVKCFAPVAEPCAYEVLPVGSGFGRNKGGRGSSTHSQRGRDDQALSVQVQDRSPYGREYLGPPEEPREPPRVRPRPARPAPQRQALRLRRSAQGQAEAARLLRQYFRAAIPRHLCR